MCWKVPNVMSHWITSRRADTIHFDAVMMILSATLRAIGFETGTLPSFWAFWRNRQKIWPSALLYCILLKAIIPRQPGKLLPESQTPGFYFAKRWWSCFNHLHLSAVKCSSPVYQHSVCHGPDAFLVSSVTVLKPSTCCCVLIPSTPRGRMCVTVTVSYTVFV